MRDIPTAILSGLAGALIVGFLSWLTIRAGARPKAVGNRQVCSYGAGPRALVLIIAIGLPGMALKSYFDGLAKLDVVLLVFAMTVVFVAYQGTEFFRTRIEYDNEAVYTFSPWRKPRVIPLSAFQEPSYSSAGYCTTYPTSGFGSVRVHDWLQGARVLVDHINAHRARANKSIDRSGDASGASSTHD